MQTTLLPPEVVEAVLRVGIVGAGNHLQCQVEARDAGTGELLALWSLPHAPYADLGAALARSLQELTAIITELAGPF